MRSKKKPGGNLRPETECLRVFWLANPDGSHDDAVEHAIAAGYGSLGAEGLRERSYNVKADLNRPLNPDKPKSRSQLSIARANITRQKRNGQNGKLVAEAAVVAETPDTDELTATEMLAKAQELLAQASEAKLTQPFEASKFMRKAVELIQAADAKMAAAAITA